MFKFYPEYINTNNDFVRSIPLTWQAIRMRNLILLPLQYGANEIAELDDPELPRYLRITDINENGTLRQETFKSLPVDIALPYLLKHGDLLFARSGATVGKTILYDESWGRSAYAGYLIRARFNPKHILSKFVLYFCHSINYWDWLNSCFIQATIQNVSAEKYANLVISVPPLAEQRAIAAFLDRETGRIDRLIALKERQIELLQEKRAALISQAVTKGLDPSVKMKDSGIPWLGEIPEHWHQCKIGYVTEMRGGSTPNKGNEDYWNGKIAWVSPKDMKVSQIYDSEDHISEKALIESGLQLIEPPAILIVVRGMILAHTFPVAITMIPVTINQDMKALKPKPGLDLNYLTHVFEGISPIIISHIEESAHGTKCLRTDLFRKISIFVPDESEQLEICNFVAGESKKIDQISEVVKRSIELLHEYRTALISAAVTGAIDVRGEIAG